MAAAVDAAVEAAVQEKQALVPATALCAMASVVSFHGSHKCVGTIIHTECGDDIQRGQAD